MVQLALAWFGWTSAVAAEELADPVGLSGE
jgi:hypothetical protein